MPWANDTPVRILCALDWPANPYELNILKGKMDLAYGVFGDQGVTIVENWLTVIEAFDQQLISMAGKANMIQADVVKWGSGGATEGIENQRNRYVNRLKRKLDLPSIPGSGSGGSVGRLVRS